MAEEELEDDDELDPMDPASWYETPAVCGSCIAWRPEDPLPGEEVASGSCKLRPELRRVPATLKMCNIYKARGKFVYEPGRSGSPKRKRSKLLQVLRRSEEKGELVEARSTVAYVPPPEPVYEAPPRAPAPSTVDLGGDESGPAVKNALVELIRRELGVSRREMGDRWVRGGAVLAATPDGKATKISTERFFASLDRLKSSLAELDKAIAARKDKLGAADTAELRKHIGAIEGSFTTFNLLFADRKDYFSSKD